MRVKGIELATGFRIENSNSALTSHDNKVSDERKYDNDPDIERNNFATASLLLALSGLVLSFLMQWRREMLQGIIGLAGMMSLFLMRIQLNNQYVQKFNVKSKNSVNINITIDYETGYWLVIACFLFIAAINIYCYIEQMKNGKMEISNGYLDG